MAEALIMPKLDMTMEQGTLGTWYKQEGDQVAKGDLIFEVQADKINIDVESPADGVLRGMTYPSGATLPVGTVLGWVVAPGERFDPPAQAAAAAGAAPAAGPASVPAANAAARPAADPAEVSAAAPGDARPRATPAARRRATELGIALERVPGSGPQGRISEADVDEFQRSAPRATPVAQKAAAAQGVDLREVKGTGTGGKVMWDDVKRAAVGAQAAPSAAAQAPAPALSLAPAAAQAPAAVGKEPERVAIKGIRSVIARRMTESYQSAPHVTLFLDADMSEFTRLRKRLAAILAPQNGPKLSAGALLAYLVTRALVRFPAVNATWDGADLLHHHSVSLAVAVDTPNGLMVPVVHGAHAMGLLELTAAIANLAEKARTGRLTPTEAGGATFTISNLGMFGIQGFTPIINQPQVAILGAGTISDKVVAHEGQIAVRPQMTLSLSFDHRALDGADGARFLALLKELLEAPERALL